MRILADPGEVVEELACNGLRAYTTPENEVALFKGTTKLFIAPNFSGTHISRTRRVLTCMGFRKVNAIWQRANVMSNPEDHSVSALQARKDPDTHFTPAKKEAVDKVSENELDTAIKENDIEESKVSRKIDIDSEKVIEKGVSGTFPKGSVDTATSVLAIASKLSTEEFQRLCSSVLSVQKESSKIINAASKPEDDSAPDTNATTKDADKPSPIGSKSK